MSARQLILILGDQLSLDLSALTVADQRNDRILMCEVQEEATYVPHHKKKIAFVFSAMRHFADRLRLEGWAVDYVPFDDPANTGSFSGEVNRAIERNRPNKIVLTEPGEWRVLAQVEAWQERFGVPVDIRADRRFLCSRAEFAEWAAGRKLLRMEHFYREMRRRTGLLMDGGKPVGGKWNFDADNRKAAARDLFMPGPARFEPDTLTRWVINLVDERFSRHFGDLEPFWFAVTQEQAEAALNHFLKHTLPSFGDYQDAMLSGERFLYHSVLSVYINAGLLDPLDICRRVEAEYRGGRVPINSAEGFIRQIIGWREYVRGIYWLKMPQYGESNFLEAKRALPPFYWTADTDMACIREAVSQTREEAYAHHIQRLMVTGNFAMLAGIDPREVHEWYLAVYADAYEWVELPNTMGMSQFADGGLLGSKPYAAGGNYINRMSDYCDACRYNVSQKTGKDACPFNYLYWDFLARNEPKLRGNPRLAKAYSTWQRMSKDRQQAYRESAVWFLNALDGRSPADK